MRVVRKINEADKKWKDMNPYEKYQHAAKNKDWTDAKKYAWAIKSEHNPNHKSIEEASKDKLLRYIGKAVHSYGRSVNSMHFSDANPMKNSKTQTKRFVGIDQAARKIAGKGKARVAANESTIDEASKNKLLKYISNAVSDYGNKRVNYEKELVDGQGVKAHRTMNKGLDRQSAIWLAAHKVAGKKVKVKATNEQVDLAVRSFYAKQYAKNYNRFLRKNPPGQTIKKAEHSAYVHVGNKYGSEVEKQLRQYHTNNELSEEPINEISLKKKKDYFDKAEKSKTAVGYGFPLKKYGNNPEYNKADKRSRIMSKVQTDIKDNTPLEHEPKVHDLRDMSHGEVYDHTQTHDGVKDGDVLHVKGGAAVMMQAWPVMVHGETDGHSLHQMKSGHSLPPRYDASVKKANALKEETINEVSADKLKRYLNKATKSYDNAHNEMRGEPKDTPEFKKNSKTAFKRVGGRMMAHDKIYGKSDVKIHAKEQTINELSAKVLTSYIKKSHISGTKAAANAESAYQVTLKNAARSGPDHHSVKGSLKQLNKANKIGQKREDGINRAASQLAFKEDTILEMSDGKIRQYIGKALGDTRKKRTKSINLAADKIEKKAKVPATLEEARNKPIPDHPYHSKTDAELKYIQKDAHEAAKNMRGHDEKAEGKYLDQVNDASTVLYYRKKYNKGKDEPKKLDEDMKLIKAHEQGGHVAKVYHDKEWGEYRVKAFPKDGSHREQEDYHTDSVEDAHSTAQHMLQQMNGDGGFRQGGFKKKRLDEDDLTEARFKIVKARIRNGKVQRRKKVSTQPGWTLRGGKLKRMSPAERRRRKLGQRRGKIKRRAKLSRTLVKRKRSLVKRQRLHIK